jgi:hypothetical protein
MSFISPLLSINPPTKGTPLSVELNKDELVDLVFNLNADPYFLDKTNWKYVLITMQSSEGKQTEVMMFDCDNVSNLVYTDFLISLTARDAWEIQTLAITDFDGGCLRLSAKDGQLDPNDFNFDLNTASLPTENSNFTAEYLSNTSIDLNWLNSGGANTGSRFSYKIGPTAPADCFSGIGGGVDVGSASGWHQLGLLPDTEYSFRLCAYNGSGIQGQDDFTSGILATATTTNPTPPVEVTDLAATVISDTEIQLTWTNNPANTGYRVNYVIGTGPATEFDNPIVIGNVATYNVTGLTDSTQYSFRVAASNNGVMYTTGDITSATTDATPSINGGLLTWSGDRKYSEISISGASSNIATNVNTPTYSKQWVYHGGTIPSFTGGKYYYEVHISGQVDNNVVLGWDAVNDVSELFTMLGTNSTPFSDNSNYFNYYDSTSDTLTFSSSLISHKNSTDDTVNLGGQQSWGLNSTLCVCIDLTNNFVWVGVDGNYSGDPTTGGGLATGGLPIAFPLGLTKQLICPFMGLGANTIATINQTAQHTIPSGFTYIT